MNIINERITNYTSQIKIRLDKTEQEKKKLENNLKEETERLANVS